MNGKKGGGFDHVLTKTLITGAKRGGGGDGLPSPSGHAGCTSSSPPPRHGPLEIPACGQTTNGFPEELPYSVSFRIQVVVIMVAWLVESDRLFGFCP